MRSALRSTSLAALVTLALPAAAAAQFVEKVYEPAGAASSSDPFVFNEWFRNNVTAAGSVGITTDYARSGNGSAYFSSASSSGKADLEYYLSPDRLPFARLGYITALGYDFYRDASSTVGGHLHAALRMRIDADGNLATSNDRGYLIYEQVYNGVATITEDVWHTATIGGTTNLWWFQSGVGVETVYNRTLATYQGGAYTPTAGFAKLTGSSIVLGLSTGVGSGWNGTYEGAVDNVRVAGQIPGVGTGSVTFNYEVAAVPEPSTYALMATGLVGLLGAARVRRRNAA